MVGNLRRVYPIENDYGIGNRQGCIMPNIVDSSGVDRILRIPPAVNGFGYGVALVLDGGQFIGVLPSTAANQVIAFPGNSRIAVEITQKPDILFAWVRAFKIFH